MTFDEDKSYNDSKHTLRPLVIVEGFLGGTPTLWGKFEEYLNWNADASCAGRRRRVIFTSIGPVSSLHDRACELYYCLKGGRVDYGEAHSRQHTHARYGRTHEQGLYPEWSPAHPLHFLGHSMGGPTIIKLQWLIQTGHFGSSAHPDMILSVNSVSSPFRGTQLVYSLGERVDDAPLVRPLSVGSVLTRAVHVIAYLTPLLPRALDLHTEARGLSYQDSSFLDLLRQLWRSEWAETRDATPFDTTFEASDDRDATGEGETNPRTFYRSYVACMTSPLRSNTNKHGPRISQLLSLPLYFCSRTMGAFNFSKLRPIPSFLNYTPDSSSADSKPTHSPTPSSVSSAPFLPDSEELGLLFSVSKHKTNTLGEEYWANDGVVPVFSQWHPRPCCATNCVHVSPKSPSSPSPPPPPPLTDRPEAGTWHVHTLPGPTTHSSILPIWKSTTRQKAFWGELGDWLSLIDRYHDSSAS